jgi:hypothetical protein
MGAYLWFLAGCHHGRRQRLSVSRLQAVDLTAGEQTALSRGLRDLERAHLVSVVRHRGHPSTVSLPDDATIDRLVAARVDRWVVDRTRTSRARRTPKASHANPFGRTLPGVPAGDA